MRKYDILFLLGLFCFIYWFLDFLNIIFLVKKPTYALWFSSIGILMTAISLIRRNPVLIAVTFCTYFVMESVWVLDFLLRVFFQYDFLGLTDYLFEKGYSRKDFIMSMYHIFIPAVLLYAQLLTKTIYKYAWVGSVLYVTTLAAITYFITDKSDIVNCVHKTTKCSGFFSSNIAPYPYYIFILIALVTLIIYIPTNYILLKVAKKFDWKIYPNPAP